MILYLNVHLWFNDLVLQPKEGHADVHEEDSSVCETARIQEEERENEDSITVNIQASGILLRICFFLYNFAIYFFIK